MSSTSHRAPREARALDGWVVGRLAGQAAGQVSGQTSARAAAVSHGVPPELLAVQGGDVALELRNPEGGGPQHDLLGEGPGDQLAQRRDDADRARHEHPPSSRLQVLHQRLGALLDRGVGAERAGELLAGRGEGGSAASVSRTRSVSIQVGCALATVTPRWATSRRSASPNRSSPALAAQYALMPGSTVNAAAELISSTCPRRLEISGSAACAVSIAPMRFTSMVWARACAELVATVVNGAMPAFVTTTSRPPKVSTVRWTAAASASESVTSASTQRCSGPSASATSASRSGSRPTRATRAPRAAALRASSAPMPRAAPVMRTA